MIPLSKFPAMRKYKQPSNDKIISVISTYKALKIYCILSQIPEFTNPNRIRLRGYLSGVKTGAFYYILSEAFSFIFSLTITWILRLRLRSLLNVNRLSVSIRLPETRPKVSFPVIGSVVWRLVEAPSITYVC